MNITLKWDQSQLDTFTGELPKRLVYATAAAIRGTALRIQQAEFAKARSVFHVRRPGLLFGSDSRPGGVAARITQFPSVKNGVMSAEISAGVAGSGGRGVTGNPGPWLWNLFEDGGTREPFTPGAKNVAVPLTGGARPNADALVPQSLTFAGMRLVGMKGSDVLSRNVGKRKGVPSIKLTGEYGQVIDPANFGHTPGYRDVQYKGRNRTYLTFSDRFPYGAIFQRTGKGAKSGRLLWVFEKPFELKAVLDFVATAQAVAAKYFAEECQVAVSDALTHDITKALRALE